ncbi:bacteriorhodopsin [Guptibacillus algicola]|uniref:bacteriorhodopsin n=1 Tax=Guptibacillus algicola TaxID=225844 RepID=UPI001CD55D11|nr:bacteriorhodopsin [Alkalihalobacillus algicola]MCA0987538.1 bacteriorhodopsin [Alkalihalobacillus algicola]
MSNLDVTLHIIYFILMITAAIYFFILSRSPKNVPLYEYVIAMIITAWSGTAYLSIALGQGVVERADRTIYFARYLDWVVTTPLLLLSLALTAMFYEKKKNKGLLIALVSADVFMILTGLIADFSPERTKYIWYSFGIIALIIVLFILWMPLRRMAKAGGKRLSRHYNFTAAYLTSFWVLYPTAWLLGSTGLNITQEMVSALSFIILPLFSKIGFGIIDLHGLRRLNQ